MKINIKKYFKKEKFLICTLSLILLILLGCIRIYHNYQGNFKKLHLRYDQTPNEIYQNDNFYFFVKDKTYYIAKFMGNDFFIMKSFSKDKLVGENTIYDIKQLDNKKLLFIIKPKNAKFCNISFLVFDIITGKIVNKFTSSKPLNINYTSYCIVPLYDGDFLYSHQEHGKNKPIILEKYNSLTKNFEIIKNPQNLDICKETKLVLKNKDTMFIENYNNRPVIIFEKNNNIKSIKQTYNENLYAPVYLPLDENKFLAFEYNRNKNLNTISLFEINKNNEIVFMRRAKFKTNFPLSSGILVPLDSNTVLIAGRYRWYIYPDSWRLYLINKSQKSYIFDINNFKLKQTNNKHTDNPKFLKLNSNSVLFYGGNTYLDQTRIEIFERGKLW